MEKYIVPIIERKKLNLLYESNQIIVKNSYNSNLSTYDINIYIYIIIILLIIFKYKKIQLAMSLYFIQLYDIIIIFRIHDGYKVYI